MIIDAKKKSENNNGHMTCVSKKGIKEKFIEFFFSSCLGIVHCHWLYFIITTLRWVERHRWVNNFNPLGNPKLYTWRSHDSYVLNPDFISSVFNFAIWSSVMRTTHALISLSLSSLFLFFFFLSVVLLLLLIYCWKYNKAAKVLICSLRSRGHFNPGVVPSNSDPRTKKWMLNCFLPGPFSFYFFGWVSKTT